MVEQNALSVITSIKLDQVQALSDCLDNIAANLADNGFVSFPNMTTIHFCCWVIVNNDPNFAPCLVLESNFDGDLDAHLDQWIAVGGAALDMVYSKCEGYPSTGCKSPGGVKAYLKINAISTPAFYVGCPGQDLASVRNAIGVRESIERFVSEEQAKGSLTGLTALQTQEKIKAFLTTLSPVKPQISPRTLDQQAARANKNKWMLIIAALFVVILTFPLLILFLIVFSIVLRSNEKNDASKPVPPPLPIDQRLFAIEDMYTQNHLTTLVNVKPGKFRLYTLKFILSAANLLAKAFFITGNLGGIPTIHFARWAFMDNDRRLLFFSNYDGSWSSYLGDFVDKANYGLTSIWSNTESFPPANFLIWGGAMHIEAFKEWSREHNLYANVWYSAYPEETLWNLQKDVRLRDTIMQNLTEEQAATLLQTL